jgi:FixJ family two-component response regulator
VISIVDDDEAVRKSLELLIGSLGYLVTSFASAEDFLASDRVDETRCLITDVQMPGLSGLELHRRLVSNGRAIPTIFVTAFSNDRIRRQALAAGAVGFLSKPFGERSLINCLETAMKHR